MQTLKQIDATSLEPFQPQVYPAPRSAPSVGLADGSESDIPSPALALQQRLLNELNAEADIDDGVRWSPRATMLFCGAGSLAAWGVIALAIAAFH
ncbi:MAG TPA: hypothetical protein VHY32_10550 [Caulobacteraceae bacterium]|jgi:hypothetical protein|nr:hypothetical protein [Caulobacteraceae bacterium]